MCSCLSALRRFLDRPRVSSLAGATWPQGRGGDGPAQSAGSAGGAGGRPGVGDDAHVFHRTLRHHYRSRFRRLVAHPELFFLLTTYTHRGRGDGEDEGDLHLAVQPQGALHRTRAGALPTGASHAMYEWYLRSCYG